MPKVKDMFPKTSTWTEFNGKLVRHYGLPNGSKFALCRKGKANSTRPFLRADSEVRRKLFRRNEHPRLGQTRVIDICRKIEVMLAPSSRSEVIALAPNGRPLDRRIMLRKWLDMQGRVTQAERDAAEMRRELVENLRQLARGHLIDLEEAVENPDSEVTEAVMRALADRYGDQSVRDALQRLRL